MRRTNILLYSVGFAAVSLLITPLSGAEDGDGSSLLTLEEALSLADKQNLLLQEVRQERESAEGRVIAARSAALPHLNLRGQYLRQDDVATFDFGGAPFEMGRKNNYEVALEARQVIFAGGGILSGVRQAGLSGDAVNSQIEYSRSQIAYQVHALFNGVLLAKENLAVTSQAVELARQNSHDVQARFDQGMATKFDLLRAQEQITRTEAEQIAAKNTVRTRRIELLKVLQLPLTDPRRIEDEFLFQPVAPDEKISMTAALQNRQDLEKTRYEVEAEKEGVVVANSDWFPKVALFGQYRYGDPTREFEDEWETSWLAGVRLEFSVFDGLLTAGKTRQQDARLRQSQLRAQNLEDMIRLEVTRAIFDLESAGEVVGARRKNRIQAEESLRLAQLGYEEGIEQQLDVLDAQLSFTRSRQLYARAVYQYIMAGVELDRAMGVLLNGAPTS